MIVAPFLQVAGPLLAAILFGATPYDFHTHFHMNLMRLCSAIFIVFVREFDATLYDLRMDCRMKLMLRPMTFPCVSA